MRRVSRRGFTLIELLVTLAILGMLSAVAAPAFAPREPSPTDEVTAAIARARMSAVQGRAPATEAVDVEARRGKVTAWPNGLVLADSTVALPPTRKEARDARP